MIKSELALKLSKRFPQLTNLDASLSIEVILNSMAHALANNSRIEIRGFGSFNLSIRSPRIGRNPKTGARVQVAAKHLPHFKPGMELKKQVL
jgi:integration host factor subunit beta